ncbi:MAG: FtsX-like permease family protein [Clostridia bacterium]|nr:FtsX-like permease family protein [Clostridia bacterium]
MFGIVLKKLIKNKWMTLCMLTGSVLIIALLSGIPIYAQGVLQRVLTKELESIQRDQGVYPGQIMVTTNYGTSKTETKVERQIQVTEEILEKIQNTYGLETISKTQIQSSERFMVYTDIDKNKSIDTKGINLTTKSELEDHIVLQHGRLFEKRDDDVIEVIATAETMAEAKLILDKEYTMAKPKWLRGVGSGMTTTIQKFVVVGIFTIEDMEDVFWAEGFNNYSRALFTSGETFDEFLTKDIAALSEGRWYLQLDYYGVKLANAEKLLEQFNTDSHRIYNSHVTWPVQEVLQTFGEKEAALNTSLFVIELPVIILLAFYIFMVSQLVMDNEANEIAVLKSRGASNMHVFCIYLIQGIMLSVVALAIGPPLGLVMCKLLGGANGFLEFVNRSALQVRLSLDAYLYGLLAAGFFIVMMLIPAIRASRKTILTHKQQVAQNGKKPLWRKLGVDFVLIAVALYGLYSYNNQRNMMNALSMASDDAAVDPLMLLISTIFILGMGLLFLRIFPLIVKVIFFIGKRFWSPAFYLSLTQVSRSHGAEQFLMLFLVFTIGVSIFSANLARTINVNQADNVEYMDGTDIVITNEWHWDYSYLEWGKPKKFYGYEVYKEVSYEDYEELETIESVTRVWKGQCKQIVNSSNSPVMTDSKGIRLVTIDPIAFAKTARMRNGLTEYHWYNYCNLLNDYGDVVILSSAFKGRGLMVGEKIMLRTSDECYRPVTIGAFVDYWPGVNAKDTMEDGTGSRYFAITKFNVLFQETLNIPLQPYDIWLKKADGVTSNDVYNEIVEKNLRIDSRIDYTEDMIDLKNDPALQSMNGALTLCFIISLVVCFAGFLIYWILSINKRVLQFGIVRAMGMKLRSLIGMLFLEQIMISGSSIAVGILIGILTSYYYVPIYSMTQSASNLVLPFRIISENSDYIRLYVILSIIIVIGFTVLAILIKKIKINNALKIGED